MPIRVTRTSPLSGKVNTLTLDATQADYASWLRGELVQRAFPHLSPEEREFIITGLMPGEWETIFPPESEEE